MANGRGSGLDPSLLRGRGGGGVPAAPTNTFGSLEEEMRAKSKAKLDQTMQLLNFFNTRQQQDFRTMLSLSGEARSRAGELREIETFARNKKTAELTAERTRLEEKEQRVKGLQVEPPDRKEFINLSTTNDQPFMREYDPEFADEFKKLDNSTRIAVSHAMYDAIQRTQKREAEIYSKKEENYEPVPWTTILRQLMESAISSGAMQSEGGLLGFFKSGEVSRAWLEDPTAFVTDFDKYRVRKTSHTEKKAKE